jgi:glycosyltransferase involved in cell wall biosynthesis
MPYNLEVWSILQAEYKCELHIVYWDHKKLSPYQYTGEQFKLYRRSEYDTDAIRNLYSQIDPQLLVVSGRMDSSYLKICTQAKKEGKKIVMASDKQWTGSWRDWFAVLFRYSLYRKYFNYAWVSGDRQTKYALKVGFSASNIFQGVYSCNLALFQSFFSSKIGKDILFIGRLEPVKCILPLIRTLKELKDDGIFNGKLKIFGTGSLQNTIPQLEWIELNGFENQDKLQRGIESSVIFCLPSTYEPWGVVIHEMAAAGLLLCCSTSCGAADHFVDHKSNGYVFKSGDFDDLRNGLAYLINLTEEKIANGKQRSVVLSNKISPNFSASQLMQILN